jgi:hypothetical protein
MFHTDPRSARRVMTGEFVLTTAALVAVCIEAAALLWDRERHRRHEKLTHISRKALDRLNGRRQ